MSPAEYVISLLGGVRPTARALNRSPSAVSKWRRPKATGGTGGKVPSAIQAKVLKIAKLKGLPINATDLIYGRTVKRKRMSHE